jgi:hypothetical protein
MLEIHTAEPSACKVKLLIENLNRRQSPGIDQIPVELRQEVVQFAMRSINVLFIFAIRRSHLRSGNYLLLYLCRRRAIKPIVVIIGAYHFFHIPKKFESISFGQV